MSDLLEKDLFSSLNDQKKNWYYKYKIYKVKKEINKYLKNKSMDKKKCLDIGCGNGIISFGIGNQINGINLDWNLVDSNFTNKDLYNDPRKSNNIKDGKKFDIVIACDVLEHIDNQDEFLQLIDNCMSKDSILIVTVPAMNILWSDHDVFLKHYRRYSMKSFKNSVENYFRILNIEYTYKSLFPLALFIRSTKKIINLFKKVESYKGESTNTFYLLNKFFLIILQFEEILSSRFDAINYLPGISLIAALKKSNEKYYKGLN